MILSRSLYVILQSFISVFSYLLKTQIVWPSGSSWLFWKLCLALLHPA